MLSNIVPSNVVDILKVGLSGFVFLLCWMSYRLLRAEQAKPHPDERILRTVNRYIWQSILCAVLVGGFGFADSLLLHQREAESGIVNTCADSLDRLDTFSKMPDESLEQLRAVAMRHVAECRPLVDQVHAH